MIRFVFLILFLLPVFSFGQVNRASSSEEKELWKSLKKASGFKKVFKKYKKYRFEIIFTQINRGIDGSVGLKDFHMGDSLSYFYPASTVKLPTAISIMEMMKNEPFYNVNLSMKLRLDTSLTCGAHYENGMHEYHRFQPNETISDVLKKYRISEADFYAWNNLKKDDALVPFKSYKVYHRKSRPSLAELIKQMLVYSDNESYNKLFEIVGGSTINQWLNDKGFKESNVSRKFAYCVGEEKSHTVSYDIVNDKDVIIYHGEERKWQPEINSNNSNRFQVGKKYLFGDEWVGKPRDFFDHNRIPLDDLHEMMQRVLFPHNFPAEQQFKLSMQSYRQLIRFLGMYPNEDVEPRDSLYDGWEDGRNIYLFNGDDTSAIDNRFRIINIVGQSYGFSTDCMYFTDQQTNTEFILSVRIYTNKNEVLGDDTYEYKEIAMPLMKTLGNYLFILESKRKKEVVPDFTILRSLFDQ